MTDNVTYPPLLKKSDENLRSPDSPHLGATIQDKEQSSSHLWEWEEHCCSIWHNCYEHLWGKPEAAHEHENITQCQNNKHLMKAFGCKPNRCPVHGKTVKQWIRSKHWKNLLQKKFIRARHLFIRMITLSQPGIKHHELEDLDDTIKQYRSNMLAEFREFRKRSIWSNSVDGGMWFFECEINLLENGLVKLNPHLHVVLLCNKKLPVEDINKYIAGMNGINLGRVWVSIPRNSNGSLKKCTTEDAINYCINYVKKESQVDGRNRGTFGTMFG